MIEGATQDTATGKVDFLITLVFNSIRLQALTMRLLVQGTKDFSADTKKDLLAAVARVEEVAEKGMKRLNMQSDQQS